MLDQIERPSVAYASQQAPALHPKIADIQILRAIAILMVLIGHLSLTSTVLAALPTKVQNPLWAGVDLFFVISGFVVVRSVMRGSLNPLAFAIRRLFRLWPAMLVFVLLSGLITLLAAVLVPDSPFAQQALITSPARFLREELSVLFGYLINRGGSAPLYINSAMWSLTIEFQFYAGVAVLMVVIVTARATRKAAENVMLGTACLLYAVILFERFSQLSGGGLPSLGGPIGYMAFRRFDFMLLGVIAYFVSRRKAIVSDDAALSLVPYLVLLPLGLILVGENVWAERRPFLVGVAMPIMGFCFAGLVLIAARGAAFSGKQSVAYRSFLWIGDRSYSIYLFHFPVMALVWVVLTRFAPVVHHYPPLFYSTIQVITVVPITLLLSDLCYRLIEIPWTDRGSRLAKRFSR